MYAAIPNWVMEIDIEDVPRWWKDELVTPVPRSSMECSYCRRGRDGGVEVNEEGDPRAPPEPMGRWER